MKGRKNNPTINSRISLTGSVIENLTNMQTVNTDTDFNNKKDNEGNTESKILTNGNSNSTSLPDSTAVNQTLVNTNPSNSSEFTSDT